MASTRKITQIAESRKNSRNLSHKNSKKNRTNRAGGGMHANWIKTTLAWLPSGKLFIQCSVLIGLLSFLLIHIVPFGLLILKKNYNINLIEINATADLTKVNNIQRAWNQFSSTITNTKRRMLGDERIDPIIHGFLDIEHKTQVNLDCRIALGFGACIDLVVDGLKVFQKSKAPKKCHPHSNIENMDQLLELFAYYFEKGAASERYIHSKSVYKELLEMINDSNAKFQESVGSNAALMSMRFAQEGIANILLGAQTAKENGARFPSQIRITGPELEADDYHVLLEFKAGTSFGKYRSARDNRLIVHSDDNNAKLQSRAFFFNQLVDFQPNLMVITGLHMLDNSHVKFDARSSLLKDLASDLASYVHNESIATKPLIHFEMASYTEARLLNAIVDDIFPFVHSYGMNEQEVENLLSMLKSGSISYSSNPFPRVAHVLDDIRELYSLLAFTDSSRVSRIHVHTLAYQVVMVKLDTQGTPLWPHALQAMTKASLTAFRHTCKSESIDPKQTKILLDDSFMTSEKMATRDRIYFNYTEPVVCWNESLMSLNDSSHTDNVQFCLAIGLVCKNVVQTGGAGDNVSAGGLVLQI